MQRYKRNKPKSLPWILQECNWAMHHNFIFLSKVKQDVRVKTLMKVSFILKLALNSLTSVRTTIAKLN
jgi:hypothetical protein